MRRDIDMYTTRKGPTQIYNGNSPLNTVNEEDSSESESEYEGDNGLSCFKGLSNKNSRTGKTLDKHELYLDYCTTYNSCFITKFLDHVSDLDMVMHGDCNAGTTITSQEG